MSTSSVPPGWRVVKLDDLRAPGECTLVGGPFGSELTTKDYVDAPGVPVIRGNNLGGKESRFVDEGFVYVTEQKAKALQRNLAFPGDLVFTQRGTLGQVAVVPHQSNFQRYVISQSQMKLTPDRSRIDGQYLYRYFRTPRVLDRLLGETQATGVPHINLGILKRFPVVVPPLDEQHRIAAILDKADALRAQRRAALTKLDALTQSIFLDMFGDNSDSQWPIRPVSAYVADFQGGKSIEADSDEDGITRNRVLKVSAVTGMRFLPGESKPVPDTYSPPNDHFVRQGDLLFSRANTTELVGAVAFAATPPANVLLPDKLWRFVWREPVTADPLFVWYLFQTPTVRREIGRRATGTSGSMKNISKEKVLGIQTILPPIASQKRFAGFVEAIAELRSAHLQSVTELDALFASLQHRAFRGEL